LVHDIWSQEGELSEAVDLPGIEIVPLDQGIDGAYCTGDQVLIPLEGFQ